ncbi:MULTISPECIES: class I SAM-dependent methyltransferase [Aequorivita]|uniref:Class I SAM-dependent methyltransferase n=1 Tax=Aequorivita iocasae TaxID=2803865 RepID=A0ABX7DRT2_9FLAO|nr:MULTISPECIES: class I SAM-dependent methyltransferase [Aequorivita]QQX76798.1 class I SAM-dependent methyltransferase [Aequorivita iocasae]UCA56270.1 class I SAM-dependent methyltransferase [Aequorivita sp. F7]
MDNKFIDISLTSENLDLYYVRTSILNSLKKTLPSFHGQFLDVGCGKMPYRNYILENSEVTKYVGLDIENALIYDPKVKPDFFWNGIKMPFENESFECAMATEVLEHCPEPEIVLKEVFRVLKPGGVFFFTVPFLWNLHEVPHDEYRYTPFSLERHLKNSGFGNIEINATGGWHAAMAQMLGLWVMRSPMPKNKRKYLSKILKPIIGYLIRKDTLHQIAFKDGQMITGLYGIAKR